VDCEGSAGSRAGAVKSEIRNSKLETNLKFKSSKQESKLQAPNNQAEPGEEETGEKKMDAAALHTRRSDFPFVFLPPLFGA
jgi:hypothetical protein